MTEKTLTTVGNAFVKKLSMPDLSKKELFISLHERLGETDIEKLDLPKNKEVVSLESQRAKIRIKSYTDKVQQVLPKIEHMKSKEQQKSALDMLEILSPKDRDYAVIACDKYLKMDDNANIEDFFKDYKQHISPEKVSENLVVQQPSFTKIAQNRVM